MNRSHNDLNELPVAAAIDLLKVHSMACEDHADKRMDSSLLLSFREWYTELNWESFHEVMACIKSLGPAWSSNDLVQRGPVSNLWNIVFAGYGYVRDPNKKLHRMDRLSSQPNWSVEEWWVESIGYAVMTYLDFDDADEAFTVYNELMRQYLDN